MTDHEKVLLASIDEMIKDAPKFGICSLPLRIIKAEIERIIKERDMCHWKHINSDNEKL